MNVEFLAIIVGLGVAIILLAVVAELMMLRSSVNKSATAVKDLLADAQGHEIGAGAPFDIAAPGQPLAGPMSTVIGDVAVSSSLSAIAQPLGRGMASPQPARAPEPLSGLSAGGNGASGSKAALTDEERAARRARRLERRKRAGEASVEEADADGRPLEGKRRRSAAALREQRPRSLNGQVKEIRQRPNESDEELVARQARRQRWLERRKVATADENVAESKPLAERRSRVTALRAQRAAAMNGKEAHLPPEETDEELAARQARRQARLERREQASGSTDAAVEPKLIRQRANESDEMFAARQERVLQRFKRRQARERSTE